MGELFVGRGSGGALEGGTVKNNDQLSGFEHFEYGPKLGQT